MWRRKRAERWERVDLAASTATPTARPPEQLWHDVVTLVTALDERDRARDIAVSLEQELEHLTQLAGTVVADLLQMHSEEAIDLDEWPCATELVRWAETARQP